VPDAIQDSWRQTLRQRLFAVAVLFFAWVAAIEGRLVYLQVMRHDDYIARAESQQNRTIEIPAPRGDLLDRNGHILAWSVAADSVYVVPSEIAEADRPKVVDALCRSLATCDAGLRANIAEKLRKKKAFAWVRRQITPEEKRRIAALELDGVSFIKESRRFYPNGSVAAHALGWVNLDNAGLGGIELSYDKEISGTPGKALVQTDARHHVFSRTERPPQSGANVELTIERSMQYIVEQELKAGVAEHRAQGGTAMIMDPWTGEILALANEPTFNPNAASLTDPVAFRNRAVEDTYEPGSTFKTVTASAALDEHIVEPGDMFDVSQGFIMIGPSRKVRDTHPNGVLSFTDGIVKSSNVLAIKVGFKVGADRMARYVRRFGFGQRLLPDLKGESPGIVWRNYTDSALASVSMGYQVGVTPLQMLSAVSSIANGGQLMQPHLVRAIQRGGIRTVVLPKVIRRTVSADTAARLTTIMEAVVERGTGKTAQVEGYTIAGKTGTAAKLIDGVYSKQKYNASFVGFFPSRKPRFAMIVVIDSPSTGPYYGGLVAAPVFKRIAQALVPLVGVPRTFGAPPTVLVTHRDESAAVPAKLEILPAPPTGPADVVPDLRGLSGREALRRLVQLGVSPRLSGDGFVVEQRPEAGTPLGDAADYELHLARVLPEPPAEQAEERP